VEQIMNEGWKAFWLFAAVFAVALGMERTFVPDIVPVAFADEPQPLWAVQAAFILRALELMAGTVAMTALVLMLAVWSEKVRLLPRASKTESEPAIGSR
jgi:hypothetical protein